MITCGISEMLLVIEPSALTKDDDILLRDVIRKSGLPKALLQLILTGPSVHIPAAMAQQLLFSESTNFSAGSFGLYCSGLACTLLAGSGLVWFSLYHLLCWI